MTAPRTTAPRTGAAAAHSAAPTAPDPAADAAADAAVDAVLAAHSGADRARVRAGVERVLRRWTAADGDAQDLARFCARHWVDTPADRARLLARIETALEQIGGHLYEMRRSLRRWSDLVGDEFPGVDDALATFDPAPDLTDQLYRQRLAFIALLNMERPTLARMLEEGASWTPEQWAEARVCQQFGPRIPAELSDHARRVSHEAQVFVSRFHVPVGTLVDRQGRRWFEPDRALLAHWLVREEIKAGYGDPDGLAKQRALAWVLLRHVDGTIPRAVMERSTTEAWDPERNTIGGKPASDTVGPERYRHWLAHRAVAARYDALNPEAPTAIARKFDEQREIPEREVERLIVDLLEHPVRERLAAFLRARLGRSLEPHDIYFEDVGGSAPAEDLNAAVRARFADEREFERRLPEVLRSLGFPGEQADFLGSRISVEIARGSGHAMRPGLLQYGAWLRTNRLKDQLGWDGFDTAMHELGHTIEQLISAHHAPRPALRNVPNTACTEAFAFLYQGLARRVIGLEDPRHAARAADEAAIATMLAACQIAGPSLVELHAWRWLYEHPRATPEDLRDAVIRISNGVWERFYARDFGAGPCAILGAYQHMVAHPLYLADYTLGHIISHQIQAHMRGRDLAAETVRICSIGRLTPDLWMRRAVGEGISIAPLATAAAAALERVRP
jgi:hypothetical protein